ncbi:MAG: IPT/TIG domain-containing protein [Deltaproteobacteria bacterium]|nr:IPT/TIG domain-containing protein [Deltaproteobacteria bacterium]
MRSQTKHAALFLMIPIFLAFGCQPDGADVGAAAVELHFVDLQGDDLRGVLSGVVDNVVVRVLEGETQLVEGSFDYEAQGGTLNDIPAGSDRIFEVEATTDSGTVVYAGTTNGVTIVGGGLVNVPVNLAPAYGVDLFAPAAIDSLQASVVGEQVQLDWLASGDDGLVGRADSYDIRVSDAPINEGNFNASASISGAPVPGEPGAAEQFLFGGLPSGTHHFAIKAVDENGNASLVSNDVSVDLSVVSDVTAPAAVADLQAQAQDDDSILLIWTAPADDGVEAASGAVDQIELRMSMAPITEANFGDAQLIAGPVTPLGPGLVENLLVEGLLTGDSLYFAIRNADEVPNWSAVSSVGPVVVQDATAPTAVSDLAVEATGPDSVLLRWTAAGDNGVLGLVSSYLVRRSTMAIDGANFAAALPVDGPVAPLSGPGQEQTLVVTGLDPDAVVHFALRAVDDAGLTSDVSNDAEGRTDDSIPPAQIVDLAVTAEGADSVSLSWTAPADDDSDVTSGSVAAYDLRYAATSIDDQAAFGAALSVTGPSVLVLPGEEQAADLSGLPVGQWHFAVVALDNRDNPSQVSNSVTACVGCPQIHSLAPTSLPVGGSLIVQGSDFGTNPGSAELGGVAAEVIAWSDDLLRVEVPILLGGLGPLDLQVTTESGLTSALFVAQFVLSPYVESLELDTGIVTLSGSGFGLAQGTSTLIFEGSAATPTAGTWSDTLITLALPGDAISGPVQVVVGGEASNGLELIVPGLERFWDGLPQDWRPGSDTPLHCHASASIAGGALVAWTEVVSTNRELVAQYFDGNAWGAAARINGGVDLGDHLVEVITDDAGDFHVAWTDATAALRCRHFIDGAAQGIEMIGTDAAGTQIAFGQLPDGNLIAAWASADGTSLMANIQDAGSFDSASATEVVGGLTELSHLSAFVDGAGYFHLVYSASGALSHLFFDGVTWWDGGQVSTITSTAGLVQMDLVADSKGYLHLAFWDDGGLLYASWDGADWTPVSLAAAAIGRPALFVDMGDAVHVVFSDVDTNTDVVHQVLDPMGVWSASSNLSLGATASLEPALAVLPDLRRVVFWEEGGVLLANFWE